MSRPGPPDYGTARKRSRDRFEHSNQGGPHNYQRQQGHQPAHYHRQDQHGYSYPERRDDRAHWDHQQSYQQPYPPQHESQYDYRGYQGTQNQHGAYQSYPDYERPPPNRHEMDRTKLPRLDSTEQYTNNKAKSSVSGPPSSKPANTSKTSIPPPPPPLPPAIGISSQAADKNKTAPPASSPRSVAITECMRDVEIGYVAYRAARARARLGLPQHYLTVAEVVSDTLASVELKSQPRIESVPSTSTGGGVTAAVHSAPTAPTSLTQSASSAPQAPPIAPAAPRATRLPEEREEGEEEEEEEHVATMDIDGQNQTHNTTSTLAPDSGTSMGPPAANKSPHPSSHPRGPPSTHQSHHHQHQHHQQNQQQKHQMGPRGAPAPSHSLQGRPHSHGGPHTGHPRHGPPPRPLPPRYAPSEYNQSFKR